MKALLLAAGLGTRLRPLTDRTPKCLVPVLGKPLLEYWLDMLLGGGIAEVLVNTHHLAEQVEAYREASRWRFTARYTAVGARSRRWITNSSGCCTPMSYRRRMPTGKSFRLKVTIRSVS